MKQIFIKGWDNKYSITSSGYIIKHYKYNKFGEKAYKDVYLTLFLIKNLGMQATLDDGSKILRTYVHLLIIEAFGLVSPDDFHMYKSYHVDGDITNNSISNISFKIRINGSHKFQPECKHDNNRNIISKKCMDCGEWLPLNRYNLVNSKRNHKKYKSTYKNNCIICRGTSARNTEYYHKHKHVAQEKYRQKDSVKEYHKKYNINGKEQMADWWVNQIIRGRGMNPDVFTPEMIETYKTNLQIEREISYTNSSQKSITPHVSFPPNKTYIGSL